MIDLENICLTYGGAAVLDNLTLHLAPGEHAALMGPSGCGKTSVLNLIVGLIRPDSGDVRVGSNRVGYVFQEPRLLPWRTAAENVNAVLSDSPATLPLARQWLARASLADAADKYPRELSGGMRQRVNLVRALAAGGDILLLDEPLTGLDDALWADMLALLQAHSAGKTVLLATHSEDEAAALAGTVYVCRGSSFYPKDTR